MKRTCPLRGCPGPRGGLATLALLSLPLALLPASAQQLSGTFTAIEHTQYAGVASQFRIDNAKVDGATLYAGTVYLFCGDLPGSSLDEDISSYPVFNASLHVGTMEEMTIWDRFSNWQNESLATAQAQWVVDNFYQDYFLAPASDAHARQYAFQNVLWEVFGDGGTAAGLDFSTGNIDRSKFGPGGSKSSPLLWSYMTGMLNDLKAAGVTVDYEPEFQILAALDSRSTYQDYLLLSANPELMRTPPVPEPGVAGLLLVAAGLLVRRRRR